jgi:sporulation protein YlmC with PRC-barrel domain
MLYSLKEMQNLTVGARDGAIGRVKDLYFDDRTWVIRYAIVDTGTWLSGREVLISPFSMGPPVWKTRVLPVTITREQVRLSPDIDTDKPVSRQHEMAYLGYYGYPYYWSGAGLWGDGIYPGSMVNGIAFAGSDIAYTRAVAASARRTSVADRALHEHDDPHLRSCATVRGYHLHANDGEIGHVSDFLVDEHTWAVQYLVVNTSNWWLGHEVLLAPDWLTEVSWLRATVSVDFHRQQIKDAPPYDSEVLLTREAESQIYGHYGRPGYWSAPSERAVA